LWKNRKKRPIGSPRLKWVDNMKMVLIWGGMEWIDLAQDRDQWKAVVYTIMSLRVPYNAGKFLSSCTTDGPSGRARLHKLVNIVVNTRTKALPTTQNTAIYKHLPMHGKSKKLKVKLPLCLTN
jgi:hypothetical protein